MAESERAGHGELLVIAAAVVFSMAGLFTRAIDLDAWTVVFWRGTVGGTLILACVARQHRRGTVAAFRGMGRAGLLAAACSTVATICFINALQRTTVADVTLIHAAAPFVAAALGWAWTGRRTSRLTLAASAVALAGVALIVGAAVEAGHLLGDLLALAMTVLMATMMVVIRDNPARSMLPASCLSAFASAALVLPAADPLAPSASAFAWLALFGVQFGLGLLLLTLGARRIAATRTALIGSLEISLAPVATWLAFAELPSWRATLGGAIVTAAVLGDILLGRILPGRSRRPLRPPVAPAASPADGAAPRAAR